VRVESTIGNREERMTLDRAGRRAGGGARAVSLPPPEWIEDGAGVDADRRMTGRGNVQRKAVAGSVTEARRFTAVLSVTLAILGGLLWYSQPGRTLAPAWPIARGASLILWSAAVALLATVVAAPAATPRIQAWWLRLTRPLAATVMFVVLTVLFLVFLPLFLFVRFRDPLRKRLGAATYWEDQPEEEATFERALRPY
jgi:hypothetical protein